MRLRTWGPLLVLVALFVPLLWQFTEPQTQHAEPVGTEPTQVTTSALTRASSPSASTAAASADDDLTGHDAEETASREDENMVLSTTRGFLEGWAERNATRRRELLSKHATTHLAELLTQIPADRVPRRRPTRVRIVEINSATATVHADDPDVELYLVSDPSSSTPWRVDGIDKRR